MKLICKISLAWLVLVVWSGVVAAQDSSDGAVKVKFRLMSWDSAVSDLNYAQGGKIIPVAMLPNGRSIFYDYQGSGTDPLLFFREVTGPDGKKTAEVAASFPVAEFKERTLLIFFRSPTSPKQYRIQAVDDSDAAIPPGSYHFINLSKAQLLVKCAGAEGTVQPGEEQTLHSNPGAGDQVASLTVDAETRNGIKHAYSNSLPYGKTSRTVVFVWQTPETGAFQVKRLQEDVTALPKPSPSRHP